MSAPTFEKGALTVYFGEKSGKYPDGNQIVVRGRDTRVAFDTPLVANRLRAELAGTDLVILGHMHEDHAAGLHLLPEARVLAHAADVEAVRSWEGLARHYGYAPEVLDRFRARIARDFHWIARPDAQAYEDAASWDLGGTKVTAFHLPGHTAGHCALLVEPEGVAFIGDIDLSSFGPYYGDATSSLADFRRTLERVKDIPAATWVTSHHKGVITERTVFLELLTAYAAKLDRREQTIADFLAAHPSSLDELVAQRFLYPQGYALDFVTSAERRTTAQHLEALVAAGRVREDRGRYFARS